MEAQFNAKQETQVNAEQDKVCTDCNQPRPIQFFLKNNKIIKTCSVCRDRRNRQNAQKRAAADAMANASTSHITMDDFFTTLKTMKDNILAAINFKFNYKDKLPMRSEHISKFRYHCAQLLDRQKKPKKYEDPTKHRDHLPMQRFHCRGWLMLTIDTEKNQIEVELVHKYHTEYADENIGTRSPNVTEKQIYYWWINFSQHIWKKDEDQIQSAIKIIEECDDTEIILSIVENGVTIISFGVIELINKLDVNAVEIGVDVTCLEPVENDELEKEDEVVDENELDVQEIDEEFAEALQEYEEGENNMNDNVIVEESNKTWKEVNGRVKENLQKWIDLLKSQEPYKDTRFLLAAEDAMSGIEKMLKKFETLRNRRTLPRTRKDCDKYTMFYKIV
ncbi:26839_t:CDS:2 [Racocetra persica]|uniref:26839_t:CDS:1 n=1 Tax=Racocetra persica TaxID=160502 RepID=A0ACA9PPG1_9GLOM|nr:26839_t:CDS:2 [Racocetra persica]